ncbi:MAG: ATP-dependent metallopeptidase FtsH/Yme1/Tma family protein, partial [Bacteroides sp.]|nr:ATP-dependent metallopeptidase FtsH/Yme1/Tma family protein [Bacteroides sp.]
MNTDNNNKTTNKPNGNKPGDPDGGKGKKKPGFNFYWVYGILALLLIALNFFNWGGSTIEISQQRFEVEMLSSQDVEKLVVVNQDMVEVFLKPDKLDQEKYNDLEGRGTGTMDALRPHYMFKIGSVENFEQMVREGQEDLPIEERVPVFYEQRRNWGTDILGWLLPIGLLIVFWLFIMRRMAGASGGGQIFNIGKSKATLFDKDTHVSVTFKNVAGLEEAKTEVMEIVDFLKNPKKYTQLGGKIPKGALLVGPPGT